MSHRTYYAAWSIIFLMFVGLILDSDFWYVATHLNHSVGVGLEVWAGYMVSCDNVHKGADRGAICVAGLCWVPLTFWFCCSCFCSTEQLEIRSRSPSMATRGLSQTVTPGWKRSRHRSLERCTLTSCKRDSSSLRSGFNLSLMRILAVSCYFRIIQYLLSLQLILARSPY